MKRLLTYFMLAALAAFTLVPFAYMTISSFKDSVGNSSGLFLPWDSAQPLGIGWNHFTLDNYVRLLRRDSLGTYVVNSFFFASMTSLLATLACAMGGYALAMFQFRGRRLMINMVLAAIIIPMTMLVAPAYQMIYRFGLLDTMTGLILPALAPPFGVFLFRQAMLGGLPGELLEAGRIDGCGEIRMFFTLALPMVRPMVSAFMMITFLASWNDFIHPQVILQSAQNITLSVAVAQLKDVYQQDYGMLMAGSMIAILPVMLLFLLLQREFIAGLTSGAVKG
jgi:multiple sugar transport system permease protein